MIKNRIQFFPIFVSINSFILKKTLLQIIFCFSVLFANAEGSKEFLANPADSANPCTLNIWNVNSGSGSMMNCPEFKRIYIRIVDPATELIDIGLEPNANNRYFRIFKPDGSLLVPGTLIPNSGNGPGRLNTFLKAIQGPGNTLVSGGYVPLVYTPTVAGDYWIEFNRDNNFVTPVYSGFKFDLWDISVVSTTTFPYTVLKGRLHCKTWNIYTGGSGISMKPPVYAYTKDSIIHKIDFNGLEGVNWTLSMNSFGVTNTGSVVFNRMSVAGDASLTDTTGEYPLFFNLPDTLIYKVSKIYLDFDTIALSGCNTPSQGITQCININTNKEGDIELLIDLNGISGYQAGTSDRIINYTIAPGNNCIPWDGIDGNGNPVPAGTSFDLRATIKVGITHIPLYDVENNPYGFIVHCLLPVNIANTPDLFYDDTGLGFGSSLYGCVSPCHPWSSVLGNANTINTWFFGTYISKTVTVTGPANTPEFNVTATNPDCSANLTNGVISYNAQSPYVFQPNDSVGIYQSPLTSPASYQLVSSPYNFTGLAPGTWSITVKTATDCSYTSTTTLVATGLPTTAMAGNDQTICGTPGTVTMDANIPLSGAGLWTQVSGYTGAIITTPSSPSTTITNLTAGIYIYQWSITSGTCPASTSLVSLFVFPDVTLTATATSDTICVGASSTLMASGADYYSWDPGGLTTSSITVAPSSTTTYSITGTSVSGCTGTSAITLNVEPILPVNIIATANPSGPICNGADVVFTAIPANGGIPAFQWFINGLAIPGQTDSLFITANLADGDNVYCMLMSSELCASNNPAYSDTMIMTVLPAANATIIPAGPFCSNIPPVILTSLQAGGTWKGAGITDTLNGTFSPVAAEEGDHLITYTIGGMCGDVDSAIISVVPVQVLTANGTGTTCVDSANGMASIMASGGTPPYTYHWENNAITQSINHLVPGSYLVLVTDANGCQESGSVDITGSLDACESITPVVYVPDIFTPNGDGINDILYVRGRGFTDLIFLIFNRWGEKVFETHDDAIGWDGTYHGKMMEASVYDYYLKLTINNTVVEKKGNVTLVR